MRLSKKLAAAAAAVLGLAGLAGSALAQEKFVYQTNWYPQAEHGGFYQALATGLYQKAGLDVTIKPGGPQLNSLQLMAAGQADCMMSTDFAMLIARNTGVPVVTVASTFQKDPQVLIAHEDVKRFEDMKGKTFLIGAASHRTFWPWLKSRYGFTDAQVRPYTFNIQPFIGDKNAVMQGFLTSEPFSLQKQGVKVNVLMFSDYGYPAYNATISCMEKTVQEREKVVAAFVRATMEGWKSYLANPAPGNELIKKSNQNMTDEQLAYSVAKLKELEMITGGDAKRDGIGTMSEERLKAGYDLMVESKVIDPAKVDLRSTYTLKFIRDIKVLP
ncbi:MAG TPA: ABC transporter substrate-binding protein [Ramlibacter sp.]|nr:ABC transporter substrate-binding protein [Ramlibacter sp.]